MYPCRLSIEGPALKVSGLLLRWTGPPLPPPPPASSQLDPSPPSMIPRDTRSDSCLRGIRRLHVGDEKSSESMAKLHWPREGREGVEPMKCRVLLECEAGEIATSCLKMRNCGSTAVYYSWEVSNLAL